MKIYTKTGDSGMSSLWGGMRVSKASARISAYGSVDELNSMIGFILSMNLDNKIATCLTRIQSELMTIGSDLATPEGMTTKIKQLRISSTAVTKLEKEIDAMTSDLPQLKSFILPSGSPAAAYLHLARTVCRRAEREVVSLAADEVINPAVQIYLNRLSDFLFTAARKQNQVDHVSETTWLSS